MHDRIYMDSEDESAKGIVSGSCLIVPYRNRDEHLKKFVHTYYKLLPDVPIFVIEQSGDSPFNRAKLFNVGVILFADYDNYIFHDVDLIIDTKRSDPQETYAYTQGVVHTGTNLQQFGYRMPDKDFFGGVNIIHREVIESVNGWSNNIWGWGNEEEFMQEDLIKNGYKIERRETFYHSLPHDHRYISHEQLKASSSVRKKGKDNTIDGLSNCNFKVNGAIKNEKYTHVKVIL